MRQWSGHVDGGSCVITDRTATPDYLIVTLPLQYLHRRLFRMLEVVRYAAAQLTAAQQRSGLSSWA